ncbi:metal ABC transporter permease [Meiothermus granaticius]|uniref:High-affinity zinc uptake system membrane protein ZnuB n=1 Tax=Meiothermus granaticius NBRC 107808 TaxID=1227551 RepID=A0A399F2S1_9DEIN|nr:metal ABC transporter permease [Meiothermus granaticius]MCL6526437.1 metal ABC transporter permease [Thermaceae bacterium]RIH91004.1 High-affinity zinc uptake system membrane protein ZnuB [Meiothermus granaticius NBRC 107808]GEM88418.1 manganese transporter [Meiothermus granaticius NBRC 107808]
MLEALQFPFLQRALLAGLMVGGLASYLGVFVVQRRLSFLGDGLAHAAFAGVALGLFFHTEPLWVALPFAVAVALAITWVRERSNLGDDTAIGIFFAVSVALGVLFMSLRQGFAPDAVAYLFGSILAVTKADLLAVGAVALLVVLAAPLWKHWAYATFDRELALADRRPVSLHDYLLAGLVALMVVTAVKVVGIVLIAAFIVIPAAAARLLSRTFAAMTLLSVSFGVLSVIPGLMVAYQLDVPAGSAIVLVQAAVFALALWLRR